LSELTPNLNHTSNHSPHSAKQDDAYNAQSNTLSSAHAAGKLSRLGGTTETFMERVSKDERQSSSSQGNPVVPAIKDSNISNSGTPTSRSTDFLENLDIQLIKLQRDEERSQQSASIGVGKEIKYPSNASSLSKATGANKVFDHELSQILKTPTPAITGSEGSQGTYSAIVALEC
jgi:hypothetical protein